jgi:hypothetical protein
MIARKYLSGIATLKVRNRDSFDFHDCAVWCVREALAAAYQLGAACTETVGTTLEELDRMIQEEITAPENTIEHFSQLLRLYALADINAKNATNGNKAPAEERVKSLYDQIMATYGNCMRAGRRLCDVGLDELERESNYSRFASSWLEPGSDAQAPRILSNPALHEACKRFMAARKKRKE